VSRAAWSLLELDRHRRQSGDSPEVLNRPPLISFAQTENSGDLGTLTELIEAGRVTSVVDRTYPLSQAPVSIDYVPSARARGKVIITM
jgi:NADPH:quinone reductase-like Zn-dependent oxidoreductase